jgi:hypothetical protein
MPLQIQISDDDIKYLNQPAQVELSSSVDKYVSELLQEASRLEAAGKTTTGDPEITSSMVKDATLLTKRGYRKPQKNAWHITLQVVASFSTLLTGLLFDFEKLKEPLMLAIFILVFSITLVTTTLVIAKE